MKKYLLAFTLLFALTFSQVASAADWRPIEGTKNLTWNAGDLKYVTDDKGQKMAGNLVMTFIKKPLTKEMVKKLSEAQTDPELKKSALQVTSEIRSFLYNLDEKEVMYAGTFFVDKDDKPILLLEPPAGNAGIAVPANTPVEQVYNYLKAEAAAGRIK